MNAAHSYGGAFTAGAGDVFNLAVGAMTLSGATSLSGATVEGSKRLYLNGATAIVGGMTFGGTGGVSNTNTVTESGGDVILGDASGDVTTLANTSTAAWYFAGDCGILLGNSAVSTITNSGLIEKSSGVGVSHIAPGIANSGTLEVVSGTLDIEGAITGTGKDVMFGASTLELDAGVAAGQSVSFTGAGSILELLDPQVFAGKLSGFDTVGTNDTLALSDVWTYVGFKENAGHTEGTMTVANGATDATVTFVGNYNASLFHSVTNTTGTAANPTGTFISLRVGPA